MVQRLTFVAIALFWIVMNVLLWRSEFGRGESGAAIPVATVWQKMLTAPDNSSLTVLYKGKRVGFCRWSVNVGQELSTGQISTEEYAPEGRIEKLTGYTIDLEGGVALGAATNRLTFDLSVKLSTNQVWREVRLRSGYQRNIWEIRSNVGDETVRLRVDNEGQRWDSTITFAELRNPEKLLAELVGPAAPAIAAGLGVPLRPSPGQAGLSINLPWEARSDWITIAHARVKAYRLTARLLDRYKVSVLVSRVGEIIRVDLPGDVILVNDDIASYGVPR